MLPEISEFSYGFALTNEIVGWKPLSAAPIFPSLIEEGKLGGGYDVKLDWPGIPLYLQFKRSECMTGRTAKEFQKIKNSGGSINLPFYRFPITESLKSKQHEYLLELDISSNLVFYTAPRFHRIVEINDAWANHMVASRSIFVSPKQIGPLDDEKHTVAFDGTKSWICSEPRSVEILNSRQVLKKIQNLLKSDDQPLGEKIPVILESLREAEIRGRTNFEEKQRERAREKDRSSPTLKDIISDGAIYSTTSVSKTALPIEAPEPNPIPTKTSRKLPKELKGLRDAADISARIFDAQLIIMQPKA